jgi:hypothetical protein
MDHTKLRSKSMIRRVIVRDNCREVAYVTNGQLEKTCLNGFDHTAGLWPNLYYFCDVISHIILCLFLFHYSLVVFCTLYNLCIKILIFLSVVALVIMVVKLVAVLSVGLAFCIVLLLFHYC